MIPHQNPANESIPEVPDPIDEKEKDPDIEVKEGQFPSKEHSYQSKLLY